jgi:hypothetical protein
MKKIKLVFTLGVIALLAGCSNILNAPEGSAPKTGTVTLTVNQGSGARTVFPSIDQFSRVALSFVTVSGANDVEDVEVINGIATINLPVGSWNVTAEAYIGDSFAPAAHSTATHTLLWSGTGDVVVVAGGTSFVLEPPGSGSGNGILHGTVKPGSTLGAGSHITITNLSGPSVVFEQYLTEGVEGDMPLAEGRYYVDVVLENEDGSASAVYHRTVVILSGLMTELQFEPGAADFLSEEARAAMASVENLVFGPTEADSAEIVIDDEDFMNGRVSISVVNGITAVYFTVSNPDGLTLTHQGATEGSADGSTSDQYLSVYEVDTSSVAGAEGGVVPVIIAATEEGREAFFINVAVTVEPSRFGLFVDDNGELVKDYDANDLADAFWWLETYAENNTSYVILLDNDDRITNYSTKKGISGVTVTLRGLVKERTVTHKSGTLTGNGNGFIEINAGTTFVLDEYVTLDGEDTPISDNASSSGGLVLIRMENSGIFKMKTGSKLTRCVSIQTVATGNSSEFIMEGGDICNNSPIVTSYLHGYGTVHLIGGSSFTMRGGRISDNLSRGVDVGGNPASTFIMEDGEISGNGKHETIDVMGAGVLIRGSSTLHPVFTMTGGKIVDNGNLGLPGAGIFQENYGTITLNGRVTISGINVWTQLSIPYGQTTIYRIGPVMLGPNFENGSESPIVVDITSTRNDTSPANLQTWWGPNPGVNASAYPGYTQFAVDFAPGIMARAEYSGVNTVYTTSSFAINADGSFDITP